MGMYSAESVNIARLTTEDKETSELIKKCPFFELIIEDESHVLNCCPRYADDRIKLKEKTQ